MFRIKVVYFFKSYKKVFMCFFLIIDGFRVLAVLTYTSRALLVRERIKSVQRIGTNRYKTLYLILYACVYV